MTKKIPDMSPTEAAELVGRYLRDVNPKTRERFLKKLKPIIEKYDGSFVLPNEVKINDTTLYLDEINSGFDGETTVTYRSIMSRPSEFSITFNSEENFYEMLRQAGGSIS